MNHEESESPTEESDLMDDIVPDVLPAHIQPGRRDFLPWHRVRKEYIRSNQWNHLTVRWAKRYWHKELRQREVEWTIEVEAPDSEPLTIESDLSKKHPLACLVIPGDDLLDVRALWRDTELVNCHIRYLGFNEGQGSDQEGTRVHIANNAVTSLPRIATDSRVLADRFERIAATNSQAYRYLQEYGPYHVVNLDFCGSIFPSTSGHAQKYYDALHRLLDYQFSMQKSEWLLFITTEVEPSQVDPNMMQMLCQKTRNNVDNHSDFANRVVDLFPIEAFTNESSTVELQQLNDEQMVQLFGLALGKWLLHLCHQAHPKWTIAMRRSYLYSINKEKGAVMLALAFEFKPNIVSPMDETGISNLPISPRIYPDESQCAVQLIESVAAIRDVDAELNNNPTMKAELRDAQAALLKSAGYDEEAYINWVNAGEVEVIQ